MNRISFKGLCLLLLLTALAASCNKDRKDRIQHPTTFTVTRADISGAVALTLCDAAATKAGETETTAEGISGLYKVDKDGNLSYVVFYIEVKKDIEGTETKTAKELNMEIRPTWIFPYGSRYIMLGGCVPIYSGDIGKLPKDLARSVENFTNGIRYVWEDGAMIEYGYSGPGYWFLMRKSDGKLFDVSEAVYGGLETDPVIPSYYPEFSGFQAVTDYWEHPDGFPYAYEDMEQAGYIHEISSGLYVSNNVIHEHTCISRISDKGNDLQIEEITNRKLGAGKDGFLMDNEGFILARVTNTVDYKVSNSIVIISPDGNMKKLPVEDRDWERVVQVGDKWYKLFTDDTLAMRIFNDGTMQLMNGSDNNNNWRGSRFSGAPKCVNGSRMAFLHEHYNGTTSLISVTIDSSSDEISIKRFPDDFPTDKELYGKEGVAYVLSEDARTITAYDITTSSSTSIQTDLSKIPAFSLPTSTYNVYEKMFYVSAYRGQENLFFRIDAVTGKAELISTNNTLKTTVFVPLN